MNKFVLPVCLFSVFPLSANALGWNLNQSGLAGVYYGVSQTRNQNNLDNLNNRLVFRADGKLEAKYGFSNTKNFALKADYTLVLRQHDKNYDTGDWRFYPYAQAEDEDWGKLSIGYARSAAYQLHIGAQDITWIGIQDSNLTYWLSGANWENKFKKVSFATPKSTNIMDDGRALKFSYYTPELYNTILGFSYTPDNANRRGMVSRYADYDKTEDGYSAAMQNKWQVGANDTFYTSVAYGLFNRTDNEWAFGARWVHGNLKISTSYKKAYIDGGDNPITTHKINDFLPAYFDNYREGQAWDFSVAYDFGNFDTSFAYLHSEATNTRHEDNIYLQTNSFELNEYIDLFLINGFINSKGLERASKRNNKGYAIISGFALKY